MTLCETYLAERGITADTVTAYGLEFDYQVSQKRVKDRLGRGVPKGVNEILWIPLRDSSETIIAWIARLFPAIADEPKFLCALNSDGAPFIPGSVYKAAFGRPIIVTEGPVKAIACGQAGVDAIGLNGVWGASTKNSHDEVVIRADLQEALDWRGRKVYLGFDADSSINPLVRQALFRLFFILSRSGAEIFQLTTWGLSHGKGIDDYLVNYLRFNRQSKPKDVLQDLLAKAKPFIETVQRTPLDLALVQGEFRHVKISALLHSQLCKQLAAPLGVSVSALEEETALASELSPGKLLRFEEIIEPWTEPVIGADLLQAIFTEVQRFVYIDDRDYIVGCLWILLAYVWDVFYKLPILRLKSPVKGCGKSTMLDVLEVFVVKPLLTVSVTPAGLYRLIEKYHPCVLIDEADSYGKDDDELRNIVNGGYERDRPVIRVNKETLEPQIFATFGCKVLASIGSLHETIEDRSVIIDMKRKAPNIKLEELCDVDHTRFIELRRKIQRWADDNRETLKTTKIARPEALSDRPWNKWRPLLTIAAVVGGHWPESCKDAAIGISSEADEELTIVTEILSRIRTLFRVKGDEFLSSDDIINSLNSDKEAPWADWQKGDVKGITVEKMSRYLKRFKIKSDRPQIENKRVRGYWLESFQDTFASYLPPEKPDPDTNSKKKHQNQLGHPFLSI
jgi:hypothetical protein